MAIPPLFVDLLTWKQKRTFAFLLSLWIFSSIIFWIWWFFPSHWTTNPRIIFNSLILSWSTIMPLYFFYFLGKMKRANPHITIPKDKRIAMVVTKAPSEPFEVVKKTLLAMIAQDIPHDNWIADEDPSLEVIAWCKDHNVFISTRKGVLEYHQNTWPRRTKCKEGNLAYFYDHFGYANYDFVSQLDADHVPEPGYLKSILKPFADPKVGYVSAPSICDLNASASWAARGRLYAEATLHGPLQAGYTDGWAPLCIGSHYAVRTKALKEIGGLGPELAEDHSTSLLFNVYGWRGAHAIDAIAHGEGPSTFSDAMTQEFQWSRSLVMLLFTLTPKVLKKLPPHLKFQFLFAQLWYPLFATIMAISFFLPIYALISGTVWVNIPYWQFLLMFSFPSFSALVIVYWLRTEKVLRPIDAKVIAWETILFQFARWPWVLWACVSALTTILLKLQLEFRVTPKGQQISSSVPFRVLLPYLILSIISSLIAVSGAKGPNVYGYYFFVLLNAFTYFCLLAAIMYQQYKSYRYSYEN